MILKIQSKGREYSCVIDDTDYGIVSTYNWYIDAHGYAKADQLGTTIQMHRLIMDCPIDKVVDHIDRNKLNNKRKNLRICTQQQNTFNSGLTRGRRYKGVSFNKAKNKYQAYICPNGAKIHLGYFSEEVDAAIAYNSAAIIHFGQFAFQNEV